MDTERGRNTSISVKRIWNWELGKEEKEEKEL